MQLLASSDTAPPREYDTVVVGSGYGGSVIAARLAARGEAVCVLERGAERHPGDYPSRPIAVARQVQVTSRHHHVGRWDALFDIRLGAALNVLVGCGLGGTSLINAGVALEMPEWVLDDRWPREIAEGGIEGLARYYRAAERMLGSNTYGGRELNKFKALERSAAGLGAHAAPVPVNITFTQDVNEAQIKQPACTLCGDCVTGCNVGAKNTVLMNYLPFARAHGATMFVGCGVESVLPDGSGRWKVSYRQLSPSGRSTVPSSGRISARRVVLAAGALGSTEILLRSRDRGLSVSRTLGHHLSGNGDILAFGYDGRRQVNAVGGWPRSQRDTPLGPTIVGAVDLTGTDEPHHRLLIEDATAPHALGPLLPAGLAALSWRRHPVTALGALLSGLSGSLERTLPYAVMSPDDDEGILTLEGDRLTISWYKGGGTTGYRNDYRRHDGQLSRAARGMGARLVHLPKRAEPLGSPLITVHPMGGCVMADAAESGVVNHACQVFRGESGGDLHPDLYVVDGSVIPRPVVANPLLTITALAERAAELMTGGEHG